MVAGVRPSQGNCNVRRCYYFSSAFYICPSVKCNVPYWVSRKQHLLVISRFSFLVSRVALRPVGGQSEFLDWSNTRDAVRLDWCFGISFLADIWTFDHKVSHYRPHCSPSTIASSLYAADGLCAARECRLRYSNARFMATSQALRQHS